MVFGKSMITSNKSGGSFIARFSSESVFLSSFMSLATSRFFRESISNGVAISRHKDKTHEYYTPRAARLPSWKPNYNTRNHLSDGITRIFGKLSTGARNRVQFFRANLLNSSLLRRIPGCACSFFNFFLALISSWTWRLGDDMHIQEFF